MTERLDDQGHGDKANDSLADKAWPFPTKRMEQPARDILRQARPLLLRAWEKSGQGALGTISKIISMVDAEISGTPQSAGALPGAYRWINDAVELLNIIYSTGRFKDASEIIANIDTLLSGVPTPQVDLGFNSPADRAAQSATVALWPHVPVACHNLGIDFLSLRAECERLSNGKG